MLTSDQNCVLSLLRTSLGVSCTYREPASVEELSRIIAYNGILLTVFPEICKKAEAGLDPMNRAKAKLRQGYYSALKQSLLQNLEGEKMLEALSNAGFTCIPLKGWEMRKLYPDQTMRQMADLDILVRPYSFGRLKTVMSSLGFSSGTESSWKHDSFQKGEVHVEMHKRLTDDSADVQKWEAEMWERAIPAEDDHVLKMAPEDYYIFHFVHLHKDFMNGSLGLRRIADTWLLQKQSIDMTAAETALKQFGLWEFHTRMVTLSRATMGDVPIDENSEILLAHAFEHGIYGSEKAYKAGRIVSMGDDIKSGKRKSAIEAVFLPYKRMKAQFPILVKWPVLLPFCWIKRIAGHLGNNLKRKKRMLDYHSITADDYEKMKRVFEAGGIHRTEV